ncbi:S8 family peptidase [Anoxybacillus flavithermus]|uniref:S8 family peptidase n=2 Tax=Anoxybacillus flavithermus TaxID=33934 RepID=UPI001866391C|nr:S8 family peptidase [Anoxybacillus flavithermus]MBE2941060.1 S8 family peptidase [Anoxybacillus flavithermus]MBE2943748.1 S8 family peptidase [Anoxybacillus flavithermus]MBE2952006.1 S8 family peptidase [Anoxybacillus flavithermus]MBE2954599.1 S8 family peptidase [Anoxybacillus flavithermus]MBE2960003.1 S8 family peptidase [Anoxybacillus flavithermus]
MSFERYDNLFIGDNIKSIPFTPKRTVVDKAFPNRDRREHGRYLQKRLEKLWQDVKETDKSRTAVSLPIRQGTYIEFESAPDFELTTKSMEDIKKGIRLLNVRTVKNEEDKEIKKATVFVPKGQENTYLKKIEDYLDKETKKGKPKNQKLIESIENIRLAVLESFWPPSQVSLIPKEQPEWCEIWLSSDDDVVERNFRFLIAHTLNLPIQEETLKFPERRVVLVKANREQLQEIILSSSDIAEIRKAAEINSFFIEMDNSEQVEWSKELLERLEIEQTPNVCICILDTGVNNGHPLLEPLLKDEDCQSYMEEWGTDDHHGHGTRMAGLSAYGDLKMALENQSKIKIYHNLESCKIVPKTGENDPKLYGAITTSAISNQVINNPNRKRIICMAITAPKFETGDGSPSSWSAAIDELTSGFIDEEQKLFIVSAGNNNDISEWTNYPESNLSLPVQNPGQSWNALTVGAYTEKTEVESRQYKGMEVVAPNGGLSPFSTTSLLWDNKWPIKPEILLEGGNVLRDSLGCYTSEDLSLLTTYYKPFDRNFDYINATSAATAKAAWMAAQIQLKYRNAWPETIRGLMVHSAEWTDTMKAQFLEGSQKRDYKKLLRICGYGVPDLNRALYCMRNSVNLIIQSELQPYDKKENGSGYKTKEMHIHKLPWPKDILLALGESSVKMRVTLSYFIEPGPGEIGWKDRYRYPSCLLRFDVNGTDTEEVFLQRINAAMESDDNDLESDGGGVRWLLGKQNRNLGSIHSDIWQGTAADLATSNLIGVYPAIGWWRERAWLGRWNRKVRYSLIVSITSEEQSVDLYTPILTNIKTGVSISVH